MVVMVAVILPAIQKLIQSFIVYSVWHYHNVEMGSSNGSQDINVVESLYFRVACDVGVR